MDDYKVRCYANTSPASVLRAIASRPGNGKVEIRSPGSPPSVRRANLPSVNQQLIFDPRGTARHAIERLRDREAGWGPDGDGHPLGPAAATLALELLDHLSDDTVKAGLAIVPNTDGGLQFEWGRQGREVEVLIAPAGDGFEVSVYGDDRSDDFEGTINLGDIQRLETEVRWAGSL